MRAETLIKYGAKTAMTVGVWIVVSKIIEMLLTAEADPSLALAFGSLAVLATYYIVRSEVKCK